MADEWKVVFYQDGRSSPVEGFIRALDAKRQARLILRIEQLRQRNVRAQEPLVKHIRGKIWELRDQNYGDAYRVLYFTVTGKRIVLLHAFQKKTNRTPSREIETAERRMAAWLFEGI